MSILHEAYLQHILQDFLDGAPTDAIRSASDDPLLNEVRSCVRKYYTTIHSIIYTGTLHKQPKMPLPPLAKLYSKDVNFRVFVNICIDNYETIGRFLLEIIRDYHEYNKNFTHKRRTAEIFDDRRNLTPLGVLKHLRCVKDGGECAEFRVLVPDEPDQQLANMIMIGGQPGMKNVSNGNFGKTLHEHKHNMSNNTKIRKALLGVVLNDHAQARNFADHSLSKFGFAYLRYKEILIKDLQTHLESIQANVRRAADEAAKIAIIEQEMNDSYALLAHLLKIANQLNSKPVPPNQTLNTAKQLNDIMVEIQKLQQTFAVLQQIMLDLKNRPVPAAAVPTGTTDAALQARIQELEAEVARLSEGGGGALTNPKRTLFEAMSPSLQTVANKFSTLKRIGINSQQLIIDLSKEGLSEEEKNRLREYLDLKQEQEVINVQIPQAEEFLDAVRQDEPPQNIPLFERFLPMSTPGVSFMMQEGRAGFQQSFNHSIDYTFLRDVDKIETVQTINMEDPKVIFGMLNQLDNNLDIIKLVHNKQTAIILGDPQIFYRVRTVDELIVSAFAIYNALKANDKYKDKFSQNTSDDLDLLTQRVNASTGDPLKIDKRIYGFDPNSLKVDRQYLSKLVMQGVPIENEKRFYNFAPYFDMVVRLIQNHNIIDLYRRSYRQNVKNKIGSSMNSFVDMMTNIEKSNSLFDKIRLSDEEIVKYVEAIGRTQFADLYALEVGDVSKHSSGGLGFLRELMFTKSRRRNELRSVVQEYARNSKVISDDQIRDLSSKVDSILAYALATYGYTGGNQRDDSNNLLVTVDDFVRLLLLFLSSFMRFALGKPTIKSRIPRRLITMFETGSYHTITATLKMSKFGRSHLKRRQKLRNRARSRHALV